MTQIRGAIAFPSLALLWLGMLLAGGAETWFDPPLLGFFYAGDVPLFAPVAIAITQLGGWIALSLVTIVATGILLARSRYRDAGLFLLISLGGRLLVELQKMWSARARPEEDYLVAVHSLSFPSGHSANSMIVYLLVALLLIPGRFAIPAAIGLSILIGLSRLWLAVHWPSDVIGGWAFGIAWTLAMVRLTGIAGTSPAPRHFLGGGEDHEPGQGTSQRPG
jgi:undecaprenyl-diphosphatase